MNGHVTDIEGLTRGAKVLATCPPQAAGNLKQQDQ